MRESIKIVETDSARIVFDLDPPLPVGEKLRDVMSNFVRMFEVAPELTAITLELDPPFSTDLSLYDDKARLWDLDRFFDNAAFAAAAWKVEHNMISILFEFMRPFGRAVRDLERGTLRVIVLKDGPRLSPWIGIEGKVGKQQYRTFRPIGDQNASAHEVIAYGFGADRSFDLIEAFVALRQS